jgi:hypothetical protein
MYSYCYVCNILCILFHCVVMWIVSDKCELYYCHRVSTLLQQTNISYITSYDIISYIHIHARARAHTHYAYIKEKSSVAYSSIPWWNENQRWITEYYKLLHYIVVCSKYSPEMYIEYTTKVCIYCAVGNSTNVLIQVSYNNWDFKKEVQSHLSQGIPLPHSSTDFSSWEVILITE